MIAALLILCLVQTSIYAQTRLYTISTLNTTITLLSQDSCLVRFVENYNIVFHVVNTYQFYFPLQTNSASNLILASSTALIMNNELQQGGTVLYARFDLKGKQSATFQVSYEAYSSLQANSNGEFSQRYSQSWGNALIQNAQVAIDMKGEQNLQVISYGGSANQKILYFTAKDVTNFGTTFVFKNSFRTCPKMDVVVPPGNTNSNTGDSIYENAQKMLILYAFVVIALAFVVFAAWFGCIWLTIYLLAQGVQQLTSFATV